MFGAAAMSLSSVCVVTNALRLKFFKVEHGKKTAKGYDTNNDQVIKDEADNKKQIVIKGMTCSHCTSAVEKALKEVDGVEVEKVDLDAKSAYITLDKPVAVSYTHLITAVQDDNELEISLNDFKGKKEYKLNLNDNADITVDYKLEKGSLRLTLKDDEGIDTFTAEAYRTHGYTFEVEDKGTYRCV